MTRLLLLIPTTSYRTHDFLTAAGKLGVDVTVASNRRQALEKLSDSGSTTVDFRDIKNGVDQITAFHATRPLSAIVSVDEATAVLGAAASEALNLPHNSPAAVSSASNKVLFREKLAQAGLPGPIFEVCEPNASSQQLADAAKYPCVLKPLSLSASRGVIRANNPAEFIAAHERITDILATPDEDGNLAPFQDIMVESYLPGDEVALEGLLVDGVVTPLALFDKPDPLYGPYFEETIYVTPSRHSEAKQKAILAMVQQGVEALGLRDGPIHAELRVDGKNVYLIELAARSIGGLCARTLSFGTDMSLEEIILRHALNLPIESLDREQKATGVMMIPIPQAGILETIYGQQDACAVPLITELTISIPIGHPVVPLPEGSRYLGFIFAKGERPEEVEAALREAHECLDIRISNQPVTSERSSLAQN